MFDLRAYENYTGVYYILKRIKSSLWGRTTYFIKKNKSFTNGSTLN